MKPLKVVNLKVGDDPRPKKVYALASEFLRAFNEAEVDRDILVSAMGLALAQMFVSAGAPEDFARFVVSAQLPEIVAGNMANLRKPP
jgi:hypothetical protein